MKNKIIMILTFVMAIFSVNFVSAMATIVCNDASWGEDVICNATGLSAAKSYSIDWYNNTADCGTHSGYVFSYSCPAYVTSCGDIKNSMNFVIGNPAICVAVYQSGGGGGNKANDTMNITFNNPAVSLIAPENNLKTTDSTFWFTANAMDDVNVTNMTLYIWDSENNIVSQITNTIGMASGTTNLSVTLPYFDTYKWNYLACDNDNNCAWSSSNRTLIYSLDIPPTVSLINPENGFNTDSATSWFGASVVDNINVATMTLYIWNSANFLVNKITENIGVISAIVNLSITLPDFDTYKWNYYACDNATNPNCAWGDNNFTVTYYNSTTDEIYPIFYDYWDNNGTLLGGKASFSVRVNNTNGYVVFNISGTNYSSSYSIINTINNTFNVDIWNLPLGTYTYSWHTWGNGFNNNYGRSIDRSYSICTKKGRNLKCS